MTLLTVHGLLPGPHQQVPELNVEVAWPGQDGCCPQGTDGTQTGTPCLGAELYFLLDGHLSNCRVTASRTVELNHARSPTRFFSVPAY